MSKEQETPFAPANVRTEEQRLRARQKQLERQLNFLERKMSHLESQFEDWSLGRPLKSFPEVQKKPQASHVPDHFANDLLSWHLWRKDLEGEEPPADLDRLFLLTRIVVTASVRGLTKLLAETKLPPNFKDSHSHAEMLAMIVRGLTGLSEFSIEDAEQAIRETPILHKMAINMDAVSRRLFHSEPWVPKADNTVRSPGVLKSLQRFVDETKRSWFLEEKDPFEKYKFSVDPRELAKMDRKACVKCRRREQLYCPSCMCMVDSPLLRGLPPVRLPVRFDIIHHPAESIRKATSLHSCILAPEFCAVHEFPDHVPRFDPETAVVLFPSKDAVYLDELKSDLFKVKTVVVVESTWQRANAVSNHPNLAGLRHIRIRDKESSYWRYQELGSTFLATLEAIFFTAVEFWDALSSQQKTSAAAGFAAGASGYAQSRHFDDLMLFYAAIHYRIGRRYGEENTDKKPPPKSWSAQKLLTAETPKKRDA